MKFVGIDVGMDTLHVAVLDLPTQDLQEYRNTPAGRRALKAFLRGLGEACRVVVEATARYHLAVAAELSAEDSIDVMVANPRRMRAFARSREGRGKTDKADARHLAAYAQSRSFRAWKAPSQAAQHLREYTRRRRQLVEQRAKEKTRRREARRVGLPAVFVASFDKQIQVLDEQIDEMTKAAVELVQANKELLELYTLLLTMRGVGVTTALEVLAEVSMMPSDLGPRELVAYVGLDPVPWQSGRADAKNKKISRQGNKRLRTTLYLAAMNAVKYSPNVAGWHAKLISKGKKPKVAYVAVARKLLHAIHGMFRTRTPWCGEKFYRLPKEEHHAA